MIISLDTIIELYHLYQLEYILVATAAVFIVIFCNISSCVYHRILAKDASKRFLMINVLNGNLAIFDQLSSLFYLGLLFCEMAEVEKNEDFKLLQSILIQIVRFYFVIKMAQMSLALVAKQYKPGF